jgi:hypothetical protein
MYAWQQIALFGCNVSGECKAEETMLSYVEEATIAA